MGREVSTLRPPALLQCGFQLQKAHDLQVEPAGDSNVAEVLASQQGGRRRAREAVSGMGHPGTNACRQLSA